MPERLKGVLYASLITSLFSINLPVYSNQVYFKSSEKSIPDSFLLASTPINSQMQEATSLFNRGQYTDAVSAFSRIIASSKSTRIQRNQALLARAQAFIVIGQPALALPDLNKTRFLQTEREQLASKYLIHGVTYIQLKNYDSAIVELNKAINMAPNEASSYANRAVAYQAIGNLAAAGKDLRRSLEIDPVPSTIYNLAVLEKTKNNYRGCYSLLERLEEVNSAYADIYFQKGICAQLLGDKDQALSDFLKAASIDNTKPEILENIGLIVVDAGDHDTGMKYLERAGELYLSQGKIDEYTALMNQISTIKN